MYVPIIILILWCVIGTRKRLRIGEQLQEARERFTAIAETNSAALQVNNNTTVKTEKANCIFIILRDGINVV